MAIQGNVGFQSLAPNISMKYSNFHRIAIYAIYCNYVVSHCQSRKLPQVPQLSSMTVFPTGYFPLFPTCGTEASRPGCPSRWPRCSRAPGVQARCPSLQSRCSTSRSLESRGLKVKLSLVFLSSCFCRSEKTTSAELSRSGRYSIHLVRRGLCSNYLMGDFAFQHYLIVFGAFCKKYF